MYLEDIKQILINTGFKNIDIQLNEVPAEYSRKWGNSVKIEQYIAHADIVAYK